MIGWVLVTSLISLQESWALPPWMVFRCYPRKLGGTSSLLGSASYMGIGHKLVPTLFQFGREQRRRT
jgi:hypothetical protein